MADNYLERTIILSGNTKPTRKGRRRQRKRSGLPGRSVWMPIAGNWLKRTGKRISRLDSHLLFLRIFAGWSFIRSTDWSISAAESEWPAV